MTLLAPLILSNPLLSNNSVVFGQMSLQTSFHSHCIVLSVSVVRLNQARGVKLTTHGEMKSTTTGIQVVSAKTWAKLLSSCELSPASTILARM